MDNKLIGTENNIVFYVDENNNTKVEVRLLDEDVWLNVNAIANLFNVQRPAIVKHINNIYNDEELEGNREVTRKREYYNLDMIISIGFRVNSKTAIKFRTWANKLIKEYIVKGFNLNDDRFIKGNKFDKKYFDELLERIKTIRVSERMSYQKITDLFIATSTDYNPKSKEAYEFFKIVQNKMHYAITGHTAAELIYERANSNKEHMGLQTWKNATKSKILESDVVVAKNYWDKEEITELNNLVSMYLDYAERQVKLGRIISMKEWKEKLELFLKLNEYNILWENGKIKREIADALALSEYEKYRIKQDQNYLSDFDELIEFSKNEEASN